MAIPQSEFLRKYGPWAVVTGASDGIGREMAMYLAELGMNLVLVARRKLLLDQLAHELTSTYQIKTQVISADLSNHDAVQRTLDATTDLNVGLLIASAGFGTSGKFLHGRQETELNMLDVNCRAVLTMTQHYGRRFAEQGHGGMILLSSIVAFQGVPLSVNYAATKAYIQSLGEGLHAELAPLGVDVLVSAPGPIDSGFAQRANMQMGMSLQPDTVARETLSALGRKQFVRPGFLSKFLIGSLSYLPRRMRIQVMGQIMKGMTQHQTTPTSTIQQAG